MTPPTTTELQNLHARYCLCTGLDIKFTMVHGYIWERWLYEGYTEPDLELTVRYIRRLIAKGQRKPESLKFKLLVEDCARFADDFAMAKAQSRIKPVQQDRESVLRVTGRTGTSYQEAVKPIADVMAQHELMASMLKEWREKNV